MEGAGVNAFLSILFMLAAAHAVCDFPLQGAEMSAAKRPGGSPCIPWYMALGCHSLIHGGAVALVTHLWWLGAAETVAHAAIDGAKCRGWFGMKTDQALHFGCKIAWAAVAVTYG
jgi:hypothetical protein